MIKISLNLNGFLFDINCGPKNITTYRYTKTIAIVGIGLCINGHSVVLGSIKIKLNKLIRNNKRRIYILIQILSKN